MKPLFLNDFEKREWIGRQALQEMSNIFKDTFKWSINYTDYKYEYFDASFLVYDFDEHKLRKRVFIEIKCRDQVWPDYILEKKKVSNMNKKMKELHLNEGEFTLLYINFTPAGTYMWDITDIKPEDCKETMYMNKATSDSRSNKVSKKYIKMLPETSKRFNYILNEELLLKKEYMKQYAVPKLEKKAKNKGFGFLFDE